MNLIVAVDSNWAIGKENKLLVSIPQDMKFFRETTKGKVVAMGRKTLLFLRFWNLRGDSRNSRSGNSRDTLQCRNL